VEKTYENGKLQEVFFVDKKNLKTGQYIAYHENGKQREQCNYTDGKIVGERLIYDYDGTLDSREKYNSNGELHGEYITYHPDGKTIQIKKIYQNNKIQGKLFRYYPNGKIMEEVHFKDNEENGPFVEYYQNGAIHWKGNYLDGDDEYGDLFEYDSTGILIKKMNCNPKGICHTIFKQSESLTK
jgi:antitoxin component YwqK of YwqJK toxin-antitoxin module